MGERARGRAIARSLPLAPSECPSNFSVAPPPKRAMHRRVDPRIIVRDVDHQVTVRLPLVQISERRSAGRRRQKPPRRRPLGSALSISVNGPPMPVSNNRAVAGVFFGMISAWSHWPAYTHPAPIRLRASMPILDAEPSVYPDNLLDELAVSDTERCWWVVYTRARQEKALARQLHALGVPFY